MTYIGSTTQGELAYFNIEIMADIFLGLEIWYIVGSEKIDW